MRRWVMISNVRAEAVFYLLRAALTVRPSLRPPPRAALAYLAEASAWRSGSDFGFGYLPASASAIATLWW